MRTCLSSCHGMYYNKRESLLSLDSVYESLEHVSSVDKLSVLYSKSPSSIPNYLIFFLQDKYFLNLLAKLVRPLCVLTLNHCYCSITSNLILSSAQFRFVIKNKYDEKHPSHF